MQGIYIDGRRPKSKKAIKEAVLANPSSVRIEATSLYGGEYDGPANDMPVGSAIVFVGPNPFTDRKFYGSIQRWPDGAVKVK